MTGSRLVVRAATRDDVRALEALERQAFATDRLSERSIRRLVAVPSAKVLVGCIGDEIAVAAILLMRRFSRAARIYSLAVSPTHRKRGYGRLLLRQMEALAIDLGMTRLNLEVGETNDPGRRLYESCGYRVRARLTAYYRDGSAALRMAKPLNPATPR